MQDLFEAFRRYEAYEGLPLLTEALEDIGLPPVVVTEIRKIFVDVEPRALTWFGNLVMNDGLRGRRPFGTGDEAQHTGRRPPLPRTMIDDYIPTWKQEAELQKFLEDVAPPLWNETLGKRRPTLKDARKYQKFLESIFTKLFPKYGFDPKTGQTGANSFVIDRDHFLKRFNRVNIDGPLLEAVTEYGPPISALLQHDRTYLGLLSGAEPLTLKTAADIAEHELEKRENPDQVVHTFDDGTYWYNLEATSCAQEGDRMGHCGHDSRGTMYSLRWKKPGRRESSSYVTIAYNDDFDTIYQIKGRSNEAPRDNTWPAIAWFIEHFKVEKVLETGEHSTDESGFRTLIDHFSKKLPDVEFRGDLERIKEIWEADCEQIQVDFNADKESENVEVKHHVVINPDADPVPRLEVRYRGWITFEFDLTKEGRAKLGEMLHTPSPSGAREYFDDLFENRLGFETKIITTRVEFQYPLSLAGGVGPGWDVRVTYNLIGSGPEDPNPAKFRGFVMSMGAMSAGYEDIKTDLTSLLAKDGYAALPVPFGGLVDKIDAYEEKYKYLSVEYDKNNPFRGMQLVLTPEPTDPDQLFIVFDRAGYIDEPTEGWKERMKRINGLSFRGVSIVAVAGYLERANTYARKQMALPMEPFTAQYPASRFGPVDIPYPDNFHLMIHRIGEDRTPDRTNEKARYLGANMTLAVGPKITEAEISASLAFMGFLHDHMDKILELITEAIEQGLERSHREDRITHTSYSTVGQSPGDQRTPLGPGQQAENQKHIKKMITSPKFIRLLAEEIVRRRRNKHELL